MKHAIFLPLFAMSALVFFVWFRMLYERIAEVVARRISPQRLATSSEVGRLLQNLSAAENFSNLAELPVMFYLGCLLALVGGAVSPALLILSWLFVLSRYVHSFIHCTYNRVRHRFYVYVFGGLALLAFWLELARQLMRAG